MLTQCTQCPLDNQLVDYFWSLTLREFSKSDAVFFHSDLEPRVRRLVAVDGF